MKKLNLLFSIPVNYAFDGTHRDASASVAADTPVTPKVMNTFQGGSELTPVPGGSPVRITRARLLSTGAKDLQTPPGQIAGEIKVSLTGNFSPAPADFTLAFTQWNAWEEKDVAIDIGEAAAFDFSILSGSVVRMDDYNIYDAYLNQPLVALMELEIQVENKGVTITH
jgi:hypothetical protein